MTNLLYIPLCIYFNLKRSCRIFKYNDLYIPLCIYFNGCRRVRFYTLVSNFTFHYVSISTMSAIKKYKTQLLYIPLCIYFNTFPYEISYGLSMLYIPLCIYFNALAIRLIIPHMMFFTFHYVSISTMRVEEGAAFLCSLHSTMYLFQLRPIAFHHMVIFHFTFHYVSISTIKKYSAVLV